MSVSGKEITNVNDDDKEVDAERQSKRKDDDFGCGYSRKFNKAKRIVSFPFRNTKNKVLRANNVEKISSSSSSSKRGGGKGCYFCFMEPKTMDSSAESQTCDPNDPDFTFNMFRALLETNDFYSKECSPHLDVVASRGSSSSTASATD